MMWQEWPGSHQRYHKNTLFPPRTAGYFLVALLGGVMIFQILMAFGLSLPGAAWGGQLDANPHTARIASFI